MVIACITLSCHKPNQWSANQSICEEIWLAQT